MTRTKYTPPKYIDEAQTVLLNSDMSSDDKNALAFLITKHNATLKHIFRLIDNYSLLLETHGPYHEVELGEPLSRFEHVLRKAYDDE